MNLNIYQRITLILGGVLFCISLYTAPCVLIERGNTIRTECGSTLLNDIAEKRDTDAIIFRGLIVWGITVPVFFALSNIKTRKKNKDDNIFKNNNK